MVNLNRSCSILSSYCGSQGVASPCFGSASTDVLTERTEAHQLDPREERDGCGKKREAGDIDVTEHDPAQYPDGESEPS
jgi:hypothetical protein